MIDDNLSRRKPASPGRGSRAFTLVELLIAVALVALLSVFLFSILDATSKLWKDNEARVDSYREARAALNFMARELAALHTSSIGAAVTFLLDPEDGTGNGQIDQSSILVDPAWASRLFFLATLPADAQDPAANRSDLCTIGYYLAYTKDKTAFSPNASASSEGSCKLFRYFRSSDPTFINLTMPGLGNPLFRAITTSPDAEVLASNISQFKIKVYRATATGLEEITSRPVTAPPHMLELSLTALNERDAARLASQADWTNHTSDLHARAARTFTTRVRLPQSVSTPPPTPAPTP